LIVHRSKTGELQPAQVSGKSGTWVVLCSRSENIRRPVLAEL
jgi:hypothetical protein